MNKQTIIGDSSPLIALAIIGQLDLLIKLYQRVVVPPEVWEEVTVRGSGLPGASEVSQCAWMEVQSPASEILQSLSILVDRGEAQAIALACTLPGSTVLLDDAQARRVAERFGVPRIGTMGILLRAKRSGFIETIKPYVAQLQENGIYIRQNLINAILRDAGELA